MLISDNLMPSLKDFESLVMRTVNYMNDEVRNDPEKANYYRQCNGTKLENEVKEILEIQSKGTDFEGTIKLVSGQSFPDIIAGKFYGVEVKTAKKNWKSVGSSIMESSRIVDVEYIFMLFGKLDDNVQFKAKPYEKCLSEIVVTHSPRYSIDMNLTGGQTIFEKMNTDYDGFRKMDAPVELVKKHYRQNLVEGQDLWWMNSSNQALSPIVRLWNTLDAEEKRFYKVKGFCWFPEIFGNSHSKYNNFAIWLTTQNGVIPTALRDIFSAGGRENIIIQEQTWESQPRIIYELSTLKQQVVEEILSADEKWVKEIWREDRVLKGNERVEQWIEIICERNNLDIKDLLRNLFL